MLRRGIVVLAVVIGLGMALYGHSHAQVMEGRLVVTDVTPVQFCVVWAASEPASGWVHVFLDPEGSIPCLEAVVKSESAEHPPAEDIGVMKVSVVGLEPDKEYFFQTETTLKKDNAVYLSPIRSVRTEKRSDIVRNDVLVQEVTIGETEPAPGMLVVASVDQASYPVSGWVADGVPAQYAAIDTNNFYDKDTHENLELQGGETVYLMVVGGALGAAETQETIPDETGGMQKLSRAVSVSASGSRTAVAVKKDSEGTVVSASGGGCFISTVCGNEECQSPNVKFTP